jgi:hypothetical protein
MLNINAISDSPLQTVEIFINGQIIKSFHIDGIQKKFNGSVEVEVEGKRIIRAFKKFAEQNATKDYQKMILKATRKAESILSCLNAD